jgi:hypothetical protein
VHLLVIFLFVTSSFTEYVLESSEVVHVVDARVEHLVLLPRGPLLHLLLRELYALHVFLLQSLHHVLLLREA